MIRNKKKITWILGLILAILCVWEMSHPAYAEGMISDYEKPRFEMQTGASRQVYAAYRQFESEIMGLQMITYAPVKLSLETGGVGTMLLTMGGAMVLAGGIALLLTSGKK